MEEAQTEKAVNAIIPAEDYKAMGDYCDEHQRSRAWFIRKAIDEKLEREGYRNTSAE